MLLPRLIGHSHALDLIGKALEEATALAHELAALPQAALRSDRLSSYEQWSLPLDEALGVEYRHGMATLETGEMLAGLDDYASGGWRTGAT
jgi:enoyl-CoA hydratase